MNFEEILLKFWGFPAFRPLQREVVQAAYEGRDTLALLPTGSGKSLCFQVPAIAKEGLCIVIAPLIALMRDQTENLRRRQIPAAAIFSGMTQSEISNTLDNCKHGLYKFLYLSPEQLASERMHTHLEDMNINLLAVDEAHCISQWGYDFRPSYLRIAQVRSVLPNVPVLALTATATPQAAKDIMEKLLFKTPNLLQKSFERPNLTYVVRHTENKRSELLKIARAVGGSAVVYVRTRRAAEDVADFLEQNNISASAYHGGIDGSERSRRQDAWQSGKTRIIAATNAFGMGIDKPDVRWVAHFDAPSSLEEYYQEAGRGGRDEKRAYAVLLYNQSDRKAAVKREMLAFPPVEEIKRIYQALGIYLEIPIGTGGGSAHDFNLGGFCSRYRLTAGNVVSALQFLQSDGYIHFSAEVTLPSRAMVLLNREDLYRTQLKNPDLDIIIKTLLRAYGGIFGQYVNIDEGLIARAAEMDAVKVRGDLLRLTKMEVISYLPQKKTPIITFIDNRLSDSELHISKENYDHRKELHHQRLEAALGYAESNDVCRSRQLMVYFGEFGAKDCGRCDVCTQKNALDIGRYEFNAIVEQIRTALASAPCGIGDLLRRLAPAQEDKAAKIVRFLMENGQIQAKNEVLEWKTR